MVRGSGDGSRTRVAGLGAGADPNGPPRAWCVLPARTEPLFPMAVPGWSHAKGMAGPLQADALK